MATRPTPRPPHLPPQDAEPEPEPELEAEAGLPEPPVRTIADEQRERSDQMMAIGVQAWMAQFDQRDPSAQPHAVEGVSNTEVEEGGSWAGSTRSTPEARAAQARSRP
jgi:hypothetical protein